MPPARTQDKAAASAAEWEERRKKLPLLAPAPPAQLSKEQLDEYQKDLRLYRTLRKELQARVLAHMHLRGGVVACIAC